MPNTHSIYIICNTDNVQVGMLRHHRKRNLPSVVSLTNHLPNYALVESVRLHYVSKINVDAPQTQHGKLEKALNSTNMLKNQAQMYNNLRYRWCVFDNYNSVVLEESPGQVQTWEIGKRGGTPIQMTEISIILSKFHWSRYRTVLEEVSRQSCMYRDYRKLENGHTPIKWSE